MGELLSLTVTSYSANDEVSGRLGLVGTRIKLSSFTEKGKAEEQKLLDCPVPSRYSRSSRFDYTDTGDVGGEMRLVLLEIPGNFRAHA